MWEMLKRKTKEGKNCPRGIINWTVNKMKQEKIKQQLETSSGSVCT